MIIFIQIKKGVEILPTRIMPETEQETTISARNFVSTVAVNLDNENLSDKEVEKALHPNKDYSCGYLGKNESLTKLINKDKLTIKKLGVGYNDFASAIEELFLFDGDVFNENPIYINEFKYSPICPWRDFCSVL